MSISLRIAETRADLDACYAIRYQVFVSEMGVYKPQDYLADRESDAYDTLASTINLLALVNEEPAGTVRIILPNESVAQRNGWKLGLPIERHFQLPDALGWDSAELPRSSVLPHFREGYSIGPQLWSFASRVASERGVGKFVAEVHPGTQELNKAWDLFHIAQNAGFVSEDIQFSPHIDVASRQELSQPKPQVSPVSRNKALREFPPTLRMFLRLGSCLAGPPIHVEKFHGISIPILWRIDALNESHWKLLEKLSGNSVSVPSS